MANVPEAQWGRKNQRTKREPPGRKRQRRESSPSNSQVQAWWDYFNLSELSTRDIPGNVLDV